MTYFVLVFDRDAQRVLELRSFANDAYDAAGSFYSEAERLAVRSHAHRDVVLFRAGSEEQLRRTHGSYFLNEKELLDRAVQELRNAASAA